MTTVKHASEEFVLGTFFLPASLTDSIPDGVTTIHPAPLPPPLLQSESLSLPPFRSLYLSVSVCVPMSLLVSLSASVSVRVCLCLSLSVTFSVTLSVSVSITFGVSVGICRLFSASIFVPALVSVGLCLCICLNLFIPPFFKRPTLPPSSPSLPPSQSPDSFLFCMLYLSPTLIIFMFVCLSVILSVYLPLSASASYLALPPQAVHKKLCNSAYYAA